MNKEPTEAQAKEFWEWCGLKFKKQGIMGINYYNTPNGGFVSEPPIDLNNLFEYAVPKLWNFGLLECIFHREIAMFDDSGKFREQEKVYYRWHLLLESQILNPIDGYGETPALALFWAIWEVIK
ncbi:hypothetical protein LCGC14_2924340 [marine sediment metagenome]|uniref:Uncharacterized protein n=1 Tax=marine sediment metagenome TaxID=412755 RepID=A0A0F8XN14_9ZZZZ